ncbi:MAG TPA: hypothetical protein VF234_03345, partial [Limnochordia bacterium]
MSDELLSDILRWLDTLGGRLTEGAKAAVRWLWPIAVEPLFVGGWLQLVVGGLLSFIAVGSAVAFLKMLVD